MGKTSDPMNRPWKLFLFTAFMMMVGFVFIVMAILFDSNLICFIVAGTFFVISFILLGIAIYRQNVMKKYNALLRDDSAMITMAEFKGAKFSNYSSRTITIGNKTITTGFTVFRKIIYSYVDEAGVQHTVKSKISYFKNQVEYLRQKGMFAIKCKGRESAIIEPVPENNKNFNN